MLQPNFRGSTGYGKKFLDAGNKQFGDKMQDDLTWGGNYLIAQGIADPKRIGIMGGSYGGYATLAGVAFTPEVYAAAVSIVGPSNLITNIESFPPYWESIRMLFHQRRGDPTTPEGKAQLERQSPLNSATRIKTPLLIVHGANDVRVKRHAVNASQETRFTRHTIAAPQAANDGTAWTRGLLLADNMRLGDFVAELARYRHGYLGCAPEVTNLRIVGAFPLADTDRVLASLERALPVRVSTLGPWWVSIEPR